MMIIITMKSLEKIYEPMLEFLDIDSDKILDEKKY